MVDEVEHKDEAIRNWAARDRHYENSQNALTQLSTVAMRSPALISGALIAALITFYSSNVIQNSNKTELFKPIITDLSIALFLAAICTLVAYFTQYCYSMTIYTEKKVWDHPFYEKTKKSKHWKIAGLILHYISIFLVITSYVYIGIAINSFIPVIS